MTDSTRRSIRTAYQILVGLLTAIPVILLGLPDDVSTSAVVVGFGAWVAIVARVINALEDAGLLPAWLKGGPR